jgi:hypothetical protein
MQTFDTKNHEASVRLSVSELLILNAALNEICNGIELFEFETRIGGKREHAAELLAQIGSLLDKMDDA